MQTKLKPPKRDEEANRYRNRNCNNCNRDRHPWIEKITRLMLKSISKMAILKQSMMTIYYLGKANMKDETKLKI